MRILSIHLFKWSEEHPVVIASGDELSFVGYIKRRMLREHINFQSRTVCAHSRPGERTSVHLENDAGRCYVAIHPSTLAATVITDPEYPERVAFSIIAELMNEFLRSGIEFAHATHDLNLNFPPLTQMLQQYQNPQEADKLMRIEAELNQVTQIMHKNIDELLKRGETLDNLMAKSEDLSSVSYDFYKRAKKNNQCCKLY